MYRLIPLAFLESGAMRFQTTGIAMVRNTEIVIISQWLLMQQYMWGYNLIVLQRLHGIV